MQLTVTIACLGTNRKTIQVPQCAASQGGAASASKRAVLKIARTGTEKRITL